MMTSEGEVMFSSSGHMVFARCQRPLVYLIYRGGRRPAGCLSRVLSHLVSRLLWDRSERLWCDPLEVSFNYLCSDDYSPVVLQSVP